MTAVVDLPPAELRDCPAPAKLNLFLHVTGRRPDGYHTLQTVFQLIDWSDTLHFRRRDDGVIARTTDIPGVPADTDLVVRARGRCSRPAARRSARISRSRKSSRWAAASAAGRPMPPLRCWR